MNWNTACCKHLLRELSVCNELHGLLLEVDWFRDELNLLTNVRLTWRNLSEPWSLCEINRKKRNAFLIFVQILEASNSHEEMVIFLCA